MPRGSRRCSASGWRGCPIPLSRARPRGGLPLCSVDRAGGILVDPSAGLSPYRPAVLRGSHPGEHRPRSARPCAAHLRPAGHPPHAGHVSHPRAHPRCGSVPVRPIQARHDQAVPQRGPRTARPKPTLNDTYDFGIGRRLCNLPALRQIGFSANRRLLNVQTLSHDCSIAEEHFRSVIQPTVHDGQRASALGFGDARVMALMHALCLFALLPNGFHNADLRAAVAPLLGLEPTRYSPGKMT
jgi:hypothetical protein